MAVNRWFFKYRGELVTPPIIFVLFFNIWKTESVFLTWGPGLFIFLLGFFVRLWAQQHLHYRLKMDRDLTTTGPYTIIRNPIYIGNTLLCVGATVISGVLWMVPITILFCAVVYKFTVRSEEAVLLEKFKNTYQNFMNQVPRWWPKKLTFKNLGLVNEYLYLSILREVHCLLLLLPFIAKEIIMHWK
ncbi:MAG: isoprenylcysteine carboxylmethyltransferase family protein [Elusimicrobiota bacterium]